MPFLPFVVLPLVPNPPLPATLLPAVPPFAPVTCANACSTQTIVEQISYKNYLLHSLYAMRIR
ncbi:MAG: hypothetical protein WAJ93_19425, partial [Candidatus Nitrosopolaris sp.]